MCDAEVCTGIELGAPQVSIKIGQSKPFKRLKKQHSGFQASE